MFFSPRIRKKGVFFKLGYERGIRFGREWGGVGWGGDWGWVVGAGGVILYNLQCCC